MQEVVNEGFTKKSSEEIGREQTEDFGKKPAPNLNTKSWYDDFLKKNNIFIFIV